MYAYRGCFLLSLIYHYLLFNLKNINYFYLAKFHIKFPLTENANVARPEVFDEACITEHGVGTVKHFTS